MPVVIIIYNSVFILHHSPHQYRFRFTHTLTTYLSSSYTQKCLRSCCFVCHTNIFYFCHFLFCFHFKSKQSYRIFVWLVRKRFEVIEKTKKKKKHITVNSLQRPGSIYKHGEMLFKISDLTDYRYKLFTAGNEWRNMLCLHG